MSMPWTTPLPYLIVVARQGNFVSEALSTYLFKPMLDDRPTLVRLATAGGPATYPWGLTPSRVEGCSPSCSVNIACTQLAGTASSPNQDYDI
jgi:hypothetical protein